MRSTHTHNNMLTKKGGGEKGGRDAWKKKECSYGKNIRQEFNKIEMQERKKSLLASFDKVAQDDAMQWKAGKKNTPERQHCTHPFFSLRGSIPTAAVRPTFHLINFSSRSRFEIPTGKLGRHGLPTEIEGQRRNAGKKQLRSPYDGPLQKSPEFGCPTRLAECGPFLS